MGCDIHGWVEVKRFATQPRSVWEGVADLGKILCRSYIMFGRLAHDGRRRKPGDRTLFNDRGLPPRDNAEKSMAAMTMEDYDNWEADAHHESYFLWSELVRERVRIAIGPQGVGDVEAERPIDYLRDGYNEYKDGGSHYKAEYNNNMSYGRVVRKWESAFGVTKSLAESYGEEQVRWVIWFDN